jgi:type IV pilus assembly protein PilW
MKQRACLENARRSRGVTLVELMVSMVLGLIVVGGALSIVLANRQSYRTNEGLSQVQESARTAFELLARDIREAGATGCDNTGRVANVLDPAANLWWQNWEGVKGYDDDEADPAVLFGTDAGERVRGTDSIQLRGIEGTGVAITEHQPASANFKINAATTAIAPNDILMACDFDHAAVFQVTNYNSGNVTVGHNTGEGNISPGNCSKGLGFPTDCTSTTGNVYPFKANSQLARFGATGWYVGFNGRDTEGGRSLYRVRLDRGGADVVEEIVSGVRDLQITYRVEGTDTFEQAQDVDADEWERVNAVSLELIVESADARVSTDPSANAGRLARTFTNVITLRNRVP